VLLGLLVPACVPPWLPFAVLADLLPPVVWPAVVCGAADLVPFDEVAFVYRGGAPWPRDLPSECFVDLWAEACLLCPVSVPTETAGPSSGAAELTPVSSLSKVAGWSTRADSGIVSLLK